MQPGSAAGSSEEERPHNIHRPCTQPERCLPPEVHQRAHPSHRLRQPFRYGSRPVIHPSGSASQGCILHVCCNPFGMVCPVVFRRPSVPRAHLACMNCSEGNHRRQFGAHLCFLHNQCWRHRATLLCCESGAAPLSLCPSRMVLLAALQSFCSLGQ